MDVYSRSNNSNSANRANPYNNNNPRREPGLSVRLPRRCRSTTMGWNHGYTMLSGYSVFGGPPFIPMKAGQWRMKPKMTDFLDLDIPGSEAVLPRWCVTSVEPATSGLALC